MIYSLALLNPKTEFDTKNCVMSIKTKVMWVCVNATKKWRHLVFFGP